MRMTEPGALWAIPALLLLAAILAAGCTSPSYTTPPTTQPTTIPTTVPTTIAPTTQPPTTTARVTPVVTHPVTTAPTTAVPTTATGPSIITIENYAFNPPSLTVSAGTTVIWQNKDQPTHRIANDATPLAMEGGIFLSGDLTTGQTYYFTFKNPGTYPYHCQIHSFMKGTVIVV